MKGKAKPRKKPTPSLRKIKYKREKFLLNGVDRFSLLTGCLVERSVGKYPADSYASFQKNSKLYLCGGEVEPDYYEPGHLLSDFFTLDYDGNSQ